MKQTSLRKRPKCAIYNVWGYPCTSDNAGPIKWAFACRCGKVAIDFLSQDEADAAAQRHFDAGCPK